MVLTVVGVTAWLVVALASGGSGRGHAAVGSGTGHGAVGSGTGGWVFAPPPAGYALSTEPGNVNGPMNASGFDEYMFKAGIADTFGYVDGYVQTYACDSCSDYVAIALIELDSAADSAELTDAVTYSNPDLRTSDYPSIPGAFENDAPYTADRGYDHEIVAAKGTRAMIIDCWTTSPRLPTPLHQLVDRQYASLKP